MTEPAIYLPVPQLQEYVASYGILEVAEGISESYFSPPLGLSGMIIQAINTQNNIISKIEGKDFFTDEAVVTGQVTFPVYGQFIGKLKSIMVFFQPLGMHQLFGNDLSGLTNKSMKLHDFIGKEKANDLLSELKADQNNSRQITVLDAFFLSLDPAEKQDEKIKNVLKYIHDRSGGVTIKEIEDHCHYSRKTLERHFKEKVGLTPKVYTKIYQFKCLINLLQTEPNITWTQLATKAGYYDQSHMSRYVKEYLKVSPNNIVKLDMELINYLLRR